MKVCVYAICKNEEKFVDDWVTVYSEAGDQTLISTLPEGIESNECFFFSWISCWMSYRAYKCSLWDNHSQRVYSDGCWTGFSSNVYCYPAGARS